LIPPEELNAFITVVGGEGKGTPLAVKDLIATKGVRTTAGSRILSDWVPQRDAACVSRMKRAGYRVVGKTNTHEFAYGTTNDNPHYGPTKNPWNPSLSTGGSSGGSAAAVAAGVVDVALGTDTAGSIRIPAALCGVVGLKPAWGTVSTEGVLPLAWSLDCVGPIGWTVGDVEKAMNALGPTPKEHKRWTIGVPEHYVYQADDEVVRSVQEALRVMEKLGCRLREVRIPELTDCSRIGIHITRSEAAAWHRRWYPARADEYGADVRAKLEEGQRLPAKDYLVALEDRENLEKAVKRVGVDLLAGPTTPVTAFPNSAPVVVYTLTYPWSLARIAAITVPCGLSRNRLPIGLQLAAPREATVLAAAAAYEKARGPWPRP
jgi:aspartyl-tRNA(Asn)/glutamyl-tRNA(Gln) amidotransferase subunit A